MWNNDYRLYLFSYFYCILSTLHSFSFSAVNFRSCFYLPERIIHEVSNSEISIDIIFFRIWVSSSISFLGAMDEQSPSEEDGSLTNLLLYPTDSGVSSSVASNDSILKHQVPSLPHLNGLSAEDIAGNSKLSSSLQDGLEKTKHLLTTGHPLGLSSVSLEVRTSGEQLNLLADGLESPLGSTGDQSQDDLEDKKTSKGGDDIADDAQECVKSAQCE